MYHNAGLTVVEDFKRKRNRYDETFKKNAVRILLDSGKPVTNVAQHLGVEQSNLHKWNKIYGQEIRDAESSTQVSLQVSDEILALKKEIMSIKETVEVLRGIVLKTFDSKYTL